MEKKTFAVLCLLIYFPLLLLVVISDPEPFYKVSRFRSSYDVSLNLAMLACAIILPCFILWSAFRKPREGNSILSKPLPSWILTSIIVSITISIILLITVSFGPLVAALFIGGL